MRYIPDRALVLADKAMVSATREADRLGKDDRETMLLWAVEIMAEYAARLEDALGGSVTAPWEQPPARPVCDDPHQWLDDRDREYERRCRMSGTTPEGSGRP